MRKNLRTGKPMFVELRLDFRQPYINERKWCRWD